MSSLLDTHLLALQGYASTRPRPESKKKKDFYFDDGNSITMQLRELVEGVDLYSDMLNTRERKDYTLQVEGEDLAALLPFRSINHGYLVLAIRETSHSASGRTARNIFEAAVRNEAIVLSYWKRPFGLLLPYYYEPK